MVLMVLLMANGMQAPTSGAQVLSSSSQDAPGETVLNQWGAGPIAIGATLDQLGEFDVSSERTIYPGMSGYVISIDDQVVALVATAGGADAPIELVIVVGTMFRTAAGIGPGSTVGAVEQAYGTAILSTGPNGGGREMLSVSSGPPGLQLVTANADDTRAGVYVEGVDATTWYSPQATVIAIWIDCRTRQCTAAPAPSSTTEFETDAEEPATEEPAAEQPPVTLANTGHSNTGAAAGFATLGGGLLAIGVRNLIRIADRDALNADRRKRQS